MRRLESRYSLWLMLNVTSPGYLLALVSSQSSHSVTRLSLVRLGMNPNVVASTTLPWQRPQQTSTQRITTCT